MTFDKQKTRGTSVTIAQEYMGINQKWILVRQEFQYQTTIIEQRAKSYHHHNREKQYDQIYYQEMIKKKKLKKYSKYHT